MTNYIEIVISKIEIINKDHALKIKDNLKGYNVDFIVSGNTFFKKYEEYLLLNGLTLDFAIDCYFKMYQDMIEERLRFIRTGRYSSTSFEEVEKTIYNRPEVMTYHMHGLILAQFLWFDQYERFKFFQEKLTMYFESSNKYLEIGAGQGLYINEAMKLLPDNVQFDLVDISESSLQLAKGILNTDKISYYLKNIFNFSCETKYDFITAGEVIEHVENPLEFLEKIKQLLTNRSTVFLTVPINSPMIDHIYLFSDEQEIRNLLTKAGFNILEEKVVISEKISPKFAKKFKVPVMYAAFIKLSC